MVLNRAMFLRPKNQLEGSSEQLEEQKSQPQETRLSCSGCGREVPVSEIRNHHYICPLCGFYWKMPARVRLQEIAEEGSLIELDEELSSRDLLNFPGYEGKLAAACKMSGENESVITGTARINGVPCAMFAMESQFMMGSMGTVTGEKITRLFEYALQQRLPVVGFCLSGGARMQKGILSLMQMAKVSGAVQRHSRSRAAVYCRIAKSHHRRGHSQLCHGRRYHTGREGGTDWFCRPARDRTDAAPKVAGEFSERGICA